MRVPGTMDRNFLRVTSILAFTETKLLLSVCFHINVKVLVYNSTDREMAADDSFTKCSVFWSDQKGQCYARHFVCRMEMVKLSHTVVLRQRCFSHVVLKLDEFKSKVQGNLEQRCEIWSDKKYRYHSGYWTDPHSISIVNCMSKLKFLNFKI